MESTRGRAGAGDLVGEVDGSAVVCVHVQPRSGRDAITGRYGEAVRVRVQAPPVDGRATEAARRLVAAAFGLPPGRVQLVSGERSRLKRFRLDGVHRVEAVARVAELLASVAPGGTSR